MVRSYAPCVRALPNCASFHPGYQAALHPEAQLLDDVDEKKFSIPYPRSQNLAYPAHVLSSEGRFMRRSEVGQSESLTGAG
jgi:hypothetical protein